MLFRESSRVDDGRRLFRGMSFAICAISSIDGVVIRGADARVGRVRTKCSDDVRRGVRGHARQPAVRCVEILKMVTNLPSYPEQFKGVRAIEVFQAGYFPVM